VRISQRSLVDVIREAEQSPLIHQELPTHTEDGVVIDYRHICYFHLHDEDLVKRYGEMFVRLDGRVFHDVRLVHDVIMEDSDGKKRITRYGICRPCAEARKLVPADGSAYLG